MKNLLRLFIIFSFLSGCITSNECTYLKPIDKNDGLTVSTLKEHNFDQIAFEKINKDICNGVYGNVHRVLVIHKNELVVEQYFNGCDGNQIHFLASTTKSFSAIMTGIAIEQAKIKDENEKMFDFFPDCFSQSNDTLKEKQLLRKIKTTTNRLV